jgi:hypothetical protein
VAAGTFFAAGAAAVGLRPLRPPAVVLCVIALGWYLKIVARRPQPAGLAARLGTTVLGLVADGYACAVMAAASARYRTLLL